MIDKLLELSSPDTGGASKAAAGGKPEVTGSFLSFGNTFSRLWGGASSGAGASATSAGPEHVWLPLAKHLQRIAGNQASTITQRRIAPALPSRDQRAFLSCLRVNFSTLCKCSLACACHTGAQIQV